MTSSFAMGGRCRFWTREFLRTTASIARRQLNLHPFRPLGDGGGQKGKIVTPDNQVSEESGRRFLRVEVGIPAARLALSGAVSIAARVAVGAVVFWKYTNSTNGCR